MNEMPLLFYVLGAMVVIWFIMLNKVFDILKTEHPLKYIEWENPFLFDGEAYTKRTGQLLFIFLMKKEYKALNNNKLTKLCDIMFYYMIIFFFLFVGLIAYMTYKEIA